MPFHVLGSCNIILIYGPGAAFKIYGKKTGILHYSVYFSIISYTVSSQYGRVLQLALVLGKGQKVKPDLLVLPPKPAHISVRFAVCLPYLLFSEYYMNI